MALKNISSSGKMETQTKPDLTPPEPATTPVKIPKKRGRKPKMKSIIGFSITKTPIIVSFE